jgi:proteasome lid subunit RPN8/RPN11
MSLLVEIFRSDDYVPDREVPLVPLLRALFADVIGPDLAGVVFELFFYQIEDLTPDRGSPTMENLRASHGFVRVRILRDGELLYQHPHPVRELIGEPLRQALRKREPEVTHWGYGVRGPGLEAIPLSRPAPRVTHEVRVRTGPRPRLRLSVEELPEPERPATTLAALGAVSGAGGDAWDGKETDAPDVGPPVVIVAGEAIIDTFVRTYPFSDEVEEGGFLAGTVYRDAGRPGGYLVHVTAVLPAERTGASMLNFTFTGESFLRVSQQLEKRGGGEELLGWYHTHLFGATSRLGLSSVDVELHRSTFRRPWQVAALVNINDDGRVLRFYHGVGDDMVLVPYWTVPREHTEIARDADTADDPVPQTEPS